MAAEVERRGMIRPITDLPALATTDGVTFEGEKAGQFYAIPGSVVGGGDPALAPIGTEVAACSSEFLVAPTGWSWLNQGTSTIAYWQSRAILDPQPRGSAANRWAAFVNPVAPMTSVSNPSGLWAVRIRMANYSISGGAGGGIIAYNSGNARFLTINGYVRAATSGGAMFTETWEASDWSNFQTQNANRFGPATNDVRSRDRFWQLRYDGTNLLWDFSPDNVHYVNYGSVAVATYLGAVTDFGIAGDSPTVATASDLGFDFFRAYANSSLNQG